MTITPSESVSREDWEADILKAFNKNMLEILNAYGFKTALMRDVPYTGDIDNIIIPPFHTAIKEINDTVRNLLQNHNNALVAEIEELKEQRNEIYKMTVEHFSNEQEKVSFFKKFVDIIRIIQEK